MDRDTLIRVGDAVAPQLVDADALTADQCSTELERVLLARLARVRSQLESLGLRFDARAPGGCFLAE